MKSDRRRLASRCKPLRAPRHENLGHVDWISIALDSREIGENASRTTAAQSCPRQDDLIVASHSHVRASVGSRGIVKAMSTCSSHPQTYICPCGTRRAGTRTGNRITALTRDRVGAHDGLCQRRTKPTHASPKQEPVIACCFLRQGAGRKLKSTLTDDAAQTASDALRTSSKQ